MQREFLGDILVSSRHLLQLINDVLDLSKVEAGKLEFHPELIDPESLVQELLDTLRTLIAQKQLTMNLVFDPTLGPVSLDPARLKQILYNYVSNAIKFTSEGGSITVRLIPLDAKEFRLEVEDTGIGIAEKDIETLFVEFHQLDNGSTKKYQGTGLGLALTRRLVEAQQGRVGVSSKPGNGSVFFAVLPRDGGVGHGS